MLNASAGRVRREPQLEQRLRSLAPDGRLRVTASPTDVGPALDALREAGVDALVVVGGDGSVAGTLGVLLERWPETDWPRVLLTPGGTVNTIAHSLGAHGAPDALVRRLRDHPERFSESRRPLVRARSAEGETHTGMIFANGVAVRWLRTYYEDSPRGVRGAASVVARIAGSALVGGELARRVFEAAAAEIEVDGARIPLQRFTVAAASSVAHVGLGFRMFPSAGTDPERFHFAVTDATARRFVREMPAYRLGRVPGDTAMAHHSARRVALRFEQPQPWSIDADLHPETRELALSATAPLAFLVS